MRLGERWFEEHAGGAPAPLGQRAAHYLAVQDGPSELAERLAGAASTALNTVLAHPGDRSAALDLLAADALVTLALKAHAAADPAGLAGYAARLRSRGASTR